MAARKDQTIEDVAIRADARLRALGDLLACAALSDYELDMNHLFTVGTMITAEAENLKRAFDETYAASRPRREAANG